MGIYNKFIKILFHMKIRLNELRSIIKNILKEYIEYPQINDFSDSGTVRTKWNAFSSQLREYLKNNLNIYNPDTEGYDNNFNLEFELDELSSKGYENLKLSIQNSARTTFTIQIGIRNNNLNYSAGRFSKWGRDNTNYNETPIFKSENNIDFILTVLKNVAKNFMNYDLDTDKFKSEIYNNEVGIGPERQPQKSLLFKSSGSQSGSQSDSSYKGNEPSDKKNIGDESSERIDNKRAIMVLKHMKSRGIIDQDIFNNYVQMLNDL
jgi:hypothetical protein